VAHQMRDLGVEQLPGELLRLLQHHAAVLGVGVVAEVGALVDEALALRIDHDAPGIAVLLELVADREVAELGRVALPLDRVAARPVAGRRGAVVERHADAVAGVAPGAAHLGELPALAEIAGAPFGVGFKAAAGEHDRAGAELDRLVAAPRAHALHGEILEQELERPGPVEDLDAVAAADALEAVDQARPAAPRFDRQPAPELELAADLERLAAVDRHEAHPLLAHPDHG